MIKITIITTKTIKRTPQVKIKVESWVPKREVRKREVRKRKVSGWEGGAVPDRGLTAKLLILNMLHGTGWDGM